jgi:hypothetical protein
MFRRAFWFTTGAAAGVWATAKVQRKLRSLAPDALAVRAADKAVEGGHRLRGFALDVRAGMARRETELNEALGLTAAPGDDERIRHDGYAGLPAPAQPSGARPELGPARAQEPPHRPHPYDRKEDH